MKQFCTICALTLALMVWDNPSDAQQKILRNAQSGPKVINLDRMQKKRGFKLSALPNNQTIITEGKTMTAGQLKSRLRAKQAHIKEARQQILSQMHTAVKSYKTSYQSVQSQRRNTLLKAARRTVAVSAQISAQVNRRPNATYNPSVTQQAQSGQNQQSVPQPVINSLNVSHGQPGDPVVITGQNFGTQQYGGVEFLVSPNAWFQAPVEVWSGDQILVYVPNVVGVKASFNGQVRIKASGKTSSLKAFRFDPKMTFKTLPWHNGVVSKNDEWADIGRSEEPTTNLFWGRIAHNYDIWGSRGDFFIHRNTRLKNGWKINQVIFLPFVSQAGEADMKIYEKYPNTNKAYVKIHGWASAWDSSEFFLSIVIKGPIGVPWDHEAESQPRGDIYRPSL